MKNDEAKTTEDQVVVRDPGSRRTFIRSGTAFLVAGAAALSARKPVYAYDCDRGPAEGEGKNAETPNSDVDSGEGADRQGCGKGKPAITRRSLGNQTDLVQIPASVDKIKA